MPPFNFGGGASPMLPIGGTLQNILGGSQATSGMFAQQQADQAEEPLKIKSETDVRTGETKFTADNISGQAMEQIMKALAFYPRALAGMQAEADRLQAQEEAARRNPLLNVLSTVAGNLAVSDPRLPPVVSALGRSSLMLNPTPDRLAAQRLDIMEQQGRTAALGAELATRVVGEQRREESLKADLEHKRELEIAKRYGEISDAAQKGEADDAALIAQSLHNAGMDSGKAITEGRLLSAISQQKRRLIDAAETAKSDRDKAKFAADAAALDKRLAAMLAAVSMKESKAETTRSDRSYQFNSKQLASFGDPIDQQYQRLGRLQDTINERTPQADALLAPELLTVMAGGQGSGLRMNEAEISRIVNGRTNLESIKAALNKWKLDPSKGLSVTEPQRQQMQKLVSVVADKLNRKRDIINAAHSKLIEAQDPEDHRKIVVEARRALTAVDEGKDTAAPSGGGGVEKWIRDPVTGKLVKSAS